jgi:hypothetical protein
VIIPMACQGRLYLRVGFDVWHSHLHVLCSWQQNACTGCCISKHGQVGLACRGYGLEEVIKANNALWFRASGVINVSSQPDSLYASKLCLAAIAMMTYGLRPYQSGHVWYISMHPVQLNIAFVKAWVTAYVAVFAILGALICKGHQRSSFMGQAIVVNRSIIVAISTTLATMQPNPCHGVGIVLAAPSCSTILQGI